MTDKEVLKFKRHYEKEFGKKVEFEEAREMAERLVKFFEILIDIDQDLKRKRSN